MTKDIYFGKVGTNEDGNPWVRWSSPPQLDDGTNPALSGTPGEPVHQDRSRWLRFWADAAAAEFGDNAGIMLA